MLNYRRVCFFRPHTAIHGKLHVGHELIEDGHAAIDDVPGVFLGVIPSHDDPRGGSMLNTGCYCWISQPWSNGTTKDRGN